MHDEKKPENREYAKEVASLSYDVGACKAGSTYLDRTECDKANRKLMEMRKTMSYKLSDLSFFAERNGKEETHNSMFLDELAEHGFYPGDEGVPSRNTDLESFKLREKINSFPL